VRDAEGIALRTAGLLRPSVTIESRAWYNPNLISRLHMVPGVMGVLLLVTTMVVMSMALVKEREQGTMEQIIVTPLRPVELIAGKLLPFVAIGFAEITLALPVILFVFDVPLRGSVWLLYACSGLFLLTTLGLGLFISTLVKTQQQAMMLAAFFVMLPFVLLSGFIFPVQNMPPLFRGIARFIPLKYYLTAVRGIFLKGAGCAELWRDALVLLVWGVLILALAVAKFRKRLD
jgi:ABC-2 type transport system permease protein